MKLGLDVDRASAIDNLRKLLFGDSTAPLAGRGAWPWRRGSAFS